MTPAGLNVVAYLAAESGIGESGRLLLEVVRAAGYPHSLFNDGAGVMRKQHPLPLDWDSGPAREVNLVVMNADMLGQAAGALNGSLMDGSRPTIGHWAWEVNVFPRRWPAAEAAVDEVWAISEHARAAIAATVDKPVHAFPLPILRPRTAIASRAALGIPEGFLFVYCFDYLSVFERKNPLAAVQAFKLAFPMPGSAVLLLKTVNAQRFRDLAGRVAEAAGGRDDIVLLDRYMDGPEQKGLIELGDAYVSLHRSEGFGLSLGEAMALGRPVIATGYSGNLDFMTAENSSLVPYELVSVGRGHDPYPPEATWADPDIDAAAAAMLEVAGGGPAVAERVQRALGDVATLHSLDARATLLRERLTSVGGDKRVAAYNPAGAVETAARARAALATAPAESAGAAPVSLPRRARDRVKRLVRRLAGYYELRDRIVADEAILKAVEATAAQLYAPPFSHVDPLLVRGAGGRVFLADLGIEEVGASKRYLEFENVFRGSEAMITSRQRRYLPLLRQHAPVLDVASGRGEMLDLLRADGVEAAGVDIDEAMVEHCRARGHTVAEGDAVSHLAGLPDASLGAVFSAQFVEHIEHRDLERFIQLCAAKLRPGGIMVIETVNPHSPAALKTFWVDLTHKTPLFPEVLMVMARLAGFDTIELIHPNGSGDHERDRRVEGEYAVIARRPPAT